MRGKREIPLRFRSIKFHFRYRKWFCVVVNRRGCIPIVNERSALIEMTLTIWWNTYNFIQIAFINNTSFILFYYLIVHGNGKLYYNSVFFVLFNIYVQSMYDGGTAKPTLCLGKFLSKSTMFALQLPYIRTRCI